jgi:hypothetical protein
MAHRRLAFETMGNATLVLLEDEAPLLATDPWLVGTAYFGSWALDHDLTPEQIGRVAAAPDVWTTSGWRRPPLRGPGPTRGGGTASGRSCAGSWPGWAGSRTPGDWPGACAGCRRFRTREARRHAEGGAARGV